MTTRRDFNQTSERVTPRYKLMKVGFCRADCIAMVHFFMVFTINLAQELMECWLPLFSKSNFRKYLKLIFVSPTRQVNYYGHIENRTIVQIYVFLRKSVHSIDEN